MRLCNQSMKALGEIFQECLLHLTGQIINGQVSKKFLWIFCRKHFSSLIVLLVFFKMNFLLRQ